MINVSISIFLWDFCRTSSLRKRWSQNVMNSVLILGFASFSQSIFVSNSSFAASNSSRRFFVDLVRMPCWIAFRRFWMAISVSRSCCSYSGRFTFSLSCKSMSMETMASTALSSITIFMVSLTTKSSIHSFLTDFLWHSVRFFLTDTHL